MHHKLSNKQKIARLVAIYTGMTLLVISIVTVILLFVLGFRFDTNNGQLEQFAFLKFNSVPSGATVTIDGKVVDSQTPNKASVPEGQYEVVMWRDGYESWRKTVDVKAGTLNWINYVMLVPKKLSVESIANYDSIYKSLASPNNHYIVVEKNASTPTFDLVDASTDTVKSSQFTIPKTVYSESNYLGVVHTFDIDQWDEGGRYILVKHTYNENSEWLVVDTQDANTTKNITKLFNLNLTSLNFSGTSGNILYCIDANNIRKIDISAGTISRSLASNVISYNLYSSNIITYIGTNENNQKVVGLYRDGDDNPSVLRTADDVGQSLFVNTTHYFNEDYVSIIDGNKVDILSGNYQNSIINDVSNLKIIKSFEISENIANVTFSPAGQYLFIQSGSNFTSYDLEYQTLVSSTIDNTGAVSPLKWLNDSYTWSDNSSSLTIREFDGSNAHTINSVLTGQDVMLTNNGRYLYSFNKLDSGYQLQRVRMILP